MKFIFALYVYTMDEGYKPTEEELELGMEETSQNTGLNPKP